MAETNNPPPAPASDGGDNQPKRTKGLLNKKQLAEISQTGKIFGLVSGDSDIFDKIKDDQIITPDFMLALKNDLHFIGQYTGDTANAIIDAKITTQAEKDAKAELIAKIRYVQSKAKLKYAEGNPNLLAEYAIGTNLEISRPTLETAATNILNKLKADTLPKITAEVIAALGAALETYNQTEVDQTSDQGDSTTLRAKLTVLVDSLAVRRRQLQHAADGEWPYTDPANAGMRRKFDLPPNNPLNA